MPSARQGPAHSLRREGSEGHGGGGRRSGEARSDWPQSQSLSFFFSCARMNCRVSQFRMPQGPRIVNFRPRKSAFFILSSEISSPWLEKLNEKQVKTFLCKIGRSEQDPTSSPRPFLPRRGPSRFQPSDENERRGPETLRSRPPKKSCEERGEGAAQETRTRTPKKKNSFSHMLILLHTTKPRQSTTARP